MMLSFPAAVTATKIFQVYGVCAVSIDMTSTNWGTATFTLTHDPSGLGTYHEWSPPTDGANALDGNDFVINAADWSGVLPLGPGHYGITITNTPTAAVKVHISGELVGPDTNTSTYGG